MKALSPFSGGNRTPRMWFYTKKLALGSLHDKRTFASFVPTSSFAEITRSSFSDAWVSKPKPLL
jgi:hypothetical protein